MAHEPRHVLGGVLARLGREVPEAPVQLDAHAAGEPLGVARDRFVQQRIKALAVAFEAQDERLVVDAGGEVLDLRLGDPDDLGELLVGVLHRVA